MVYLVVLHYIFVFFFFKQKTAYEMRISDWSSDVCSSDLDGRIKLYISKTKAIDFRVSTCPTLFGEKICCRILDPSSAQLGIDALGYEPEQKDAYMKSLAQPQGMILVTGPTGSGKTVSLYTGLNILRSEEHTSELQSLMRISYAVFCLKKKKNTS